MQQKWVEVMHERTPGTTPTLEETGGPFLETWTTCGCGYGWRAIIAWGTVGRTCPCCLARDPGFVWPWPGGYRGYAITPSV